MFGGDEMKSGESCLGGDKGEETLCILIAVKT